MHRQVLIFHPAMIFFLLSGDHISSDNLARDARAQSSCRGLADTASAYNDKIEVAERYRPDDFEKHNKQFRNHVPDARYSKDPFLCGLAKLQQNIIQHN